LIEWAGENRDREYRVCDGDIRPPVKVQVGQ